MARLVMIGDRLTHPGIGLPTVLFFLLCQIRILKRIENVIEFAFELFKFCTEHVASLLAAVIRGVVPVQERSVALA